MTPETLFPWLLAAGHLALNLWQYRQAGRERAQAAAREEAHTAERGRLISHLTGEAIRRVAPDGEPQPARAYGTDHDEWLIEQQRQKSRESV